MFEPACKNMDNVLWQEAGCATELDYTEQTSWLLFLKYLEGLEEAKAMEAQLSGKKYTLILDQPSSTRSSFGLRRPSAAFPRPRRRHRLETLDDQKQTALEALK